MIPYGIFRYPYHYFTHLSPFSVFTSLSLSEESSFSQARDCLLKWVWALRQSLHHWKCSHCHLPRLLYSLLASPPNWVLFMSHVFYFPPFFSPLESVHPFSWPLSNAHICKFKSGFWIWKKIDGVCHSESNLFHLTWCSPGPICFPDNVISFFSLAE